MRTSHKHLRWFVVAVMWAVGAWAVAGQVSNPDQLATHAAPEATVNALRAPSAKPVESYERMVITTRALAPSRRRSSG